MHPLMSIWSMLACSGTTIWAASGFSLSLNTSVLLRVDRVLFHVIPLVLVIQTKFSCSSACACVVSVAALVVRAINAIAIRCLYVLIVFVFAVLVFLLLLTV